MDLKLDGINKCRTCIQRIGVHLLQKEVQFPESTSLTLSELISTVSLVQLNPGSHFPQQICESCEALAINSYQFILTCRKSEQYWKTKQSLSLTKNEDINSQDNYINEDTSVRNCIFKHNGDTNDYESISSPGVVTNISDDSVENQNVFDSANTKNIQKQKNEAKVANDIDKVKCDLLFCPLCSESYKDKDALTEHVKLHATDCEKCNIKFQTPLRLMKHLGKNHCERKRDSRDVPYISENKRTCAECGKVFQYRASMLKHRKKHGAPPQTCLFCDFVPTNSSKIAQHMEKKHSHLKNISCTICGKMFFKEANLHLHMVIHSGVKKHTCEMCGLSFTLACNLLAHRRLHTGERPYTCSHCGRGFTQQSALRSHEACHSNKRDHVCADCGAAFSRPGALNNHRKRHSSAKPYVCSLCNKAFTFSSERKRHMTIHSGDKNHVCDVCGRRFNRSTNLRVHHKIHTGETPHICKVCGKGFIQAHCLRTHMKTHLPTEIPIT